MIPSNHSANDQVYSNNNNLGKSNVIKEKVINNPVVSQSGQVEIKIEYLQGIPYT